MIGTLTFKRVNEELKRVETVVVKDVPLDYASAYVFKHGVTIATWDNGHNKVWL